MKRAIRKSGTSTKAAVRKDNEAFRKRFKKKKKKKHSPRKRKGQGLKYSDYLKTKWWQGRRMMKLKRAGFGCEECGKKNVRLDVHHKTYRNKGREQPQDLIVLCELCHIYEHFGFGVKLSAAILREREENS